MRRVKSRFVLVSATALALAAGWSSSTAPTALAQPAAAQAPLKIAIANPGHIFSELAEFKAVLIQMQDQQKKLAAEQGDKMKAINDLKTRRDALLPEHPQWSELNSQLAALTADYRVWVETQKVNAESTEKFKMAALFKKIEQAVAEIAKRDGIDLVIADNRDPLPANLDEVDVRTLRGVLLSRDVIYATDRIDITQAVVTLLDAKYRGIAAAGK
jgi:outer membrane protein